MLLLSSADFFKINFFKKLFQEHIVSNGLDPDQGRNSVGMILVITVCKRLSKVTVNKERVIILSIISFYISYPVLSA